MKRYVKIILVLVGLLLVGCGYKTPPVYVKIAKDIKYEKK